MVVIFKAVDKVSPLIRRELNGCLHLVYFALEFQFLVGARLEEEPFIATGQVLSHLFQLLSSVQGGQSL